MSVFHRNEGYYFEMQLNLYKKTTLGTSEKQ